MDTVKGIEERGGLAFWEIEVIVDIVGRMDREYEARWRRWVTGLWLGRGADVRKTRWVDEYEEGGGRKYGLA